MTRPEARFLVDVWPLSMGPGPWIWGSPPRGKMLVGSGCNGAMSVVTWARVVLIVASALGLTLGEGLGSNRYSDSSYSLKAHSSGLDLKRVAALSRGSEKTPALRSDSPTKFTESESEVRSRLANSSPEPANLPRQLYLPTCLPTGSSCIIPPTTVLRGESPLRLRCRPSRSVRPGA